MGCISKFLMTAGVLWGFNYLGWISFAELAVFWKIALTAFLIILLMDLLLWFPKFLTKIATLPASCLTVGAFSWVIEGLFKYFGLVIAAKWTSLFIIPWIFGVFWWQALIIIGTLSVIAYIMTPKVRYITRYSNSSSS